MNVPRFARESLDADTGSGAVFSNCTTTANLDAKNMVLKEAFVKMTYFAIEVVDRFG